MRSVYDATSVDNLVAIKRLLALQLVSSGVRVADIASTLELPPKVVRQWIPKEWRVR